MLRCTSSRCASYSEGILRRSMRRKPTDDPFLRSPTTTQRTLKTFRELPWVFRYSMVFMVGFIIGGVIEVFACKTHLYEAVMANKDTRRHKLDEFVVDFRRNVDKWQREDMKNQQKA